MINDKLKNKLLGVSNDIIIDTNKEGTVINNFYNPKLTEDEFEMTKDIIFNNVKELSDEEIKQKEKEELKEEKLRMQLLGKSKKEQFMILYKKEHNHGKGKSKSKRKRK